MILLKMQNLKLFAFLFLEIRHHILPPQEGKESSGLDIYPLESTKIRKNHFLSLKIFFYGPKLYTPMHFPGFQAKQKKIHMFNFLRRLV